VDSGLVCLPVGSVCDGPAVDACLRVLASYEKSISLSMVRVRSLAARDEERVCGEPKLRGLDFVAGATVGSADLPVDACEEGLYRYQTR
jgi:hypothetical protein